MDAMLNVDGWISEQMGGLMLELFIILKVLVITCILIKFTNIKKSFAWFTICVLIVSVCIYPNNVEGIFKSIFFYLPDLALGSSTVMS